MLTKLQCPATASPQRSMSHMGPTSGSAPPDSSRYGADTQVLLGAFFEMVFVIGLIGTAVAP